MGRIKPQALLLQSKRKKAPAKINVATIIFCNIAIILVLVFFVAIHRHRSKSGRPLLSGFSHLQGDRKLKLPLDQSNTDVQYAIINTSMGTISLELYVKEAPKAVENFLTHSRNGYYNGVLFHRVIKGFMVQAGDPKGDGTGGESIWGGFFEDEFHPSLKHEPFTLSMANKGPNSNGSQFFITSVATPHLDNHHTVFGHVVKGQDIVKQIESVQTDEKDRPLSPVKINDISIVDEL